MIKFRCKCGKVLQVKVEHAGRQLKCPACESTVRIPTPKTQATGETDEVSKAKIAAEDSPSGSQPSKQRKTSAPAASAKKKKSAAAAAAPVRKKRRKPTPPPEEEEFEELEEVDELDEFDDVGDDYGYDDYGDDAGGYDDYAAPALPTPKRKKSGNKKSKKKDEPSPTASEDGIPPKVMYSLYGLSGVVVLVALIFIGRSIMNANQDAAASMAIPEQFEKWSHKGGGLSVDCPAGWAQKSGGGTGGVPPWASFENKDQEVKIMVRGSVSGTAISDIATAGGSVPGDLGGDIPDELDPIAGVHEYQKQKIGSEYDEYEEGEPRKIDSGLGEGRISDFTGSKLFSQTCGVRATLVSSQYQYNIICTCPENRLGEYTPIFERIVTSVGR